MSYLGELLAARRADVERAKREWPLADLVRRSEKRTERRDFAGALRVGKPAVIAEIKRASPSAGAIASAADSALLAAAYERGGAAAISVLTEPRRFNGSLDDLILARKACTLPILRKDFIVDEYQIWEAAAYGADAILLITAALDNGQLAAFVTLARKLSLAALVEVHDAGEADRARRAGASLIGINNRDLHTFEVRRSTAIELARRLRQGGLLDSSPAGLTIVAESGYSSVADLAECAAIGIDAVLIGEHLMRSPEPEQTLRTLVMGAAPRPRVKICGMRSVGDVELCASAGADAMGFILADSPRRLTPTKAAELIEAVPMGVTRVGVFADSPRELIDEALRSCRIDVLQFSGHEPPDFCGSFGKPTILVARDEAPAPEAVRAANAIAIMADRRTDGKAGGTGIAVPLDAAQRMRAGVSGHFILAGGLTPTSVAGAIRAIRPDGVDVRSGVERDGQKDAAMVRQFIAAAREALDAGA